MYRGMGAGESIDYIWKAPWATNKFCQSWLGFLDPACTPPTAAEIAADTSNYGRLLSPESRVSATAMAESVIAADIKANPCLYSEIDSGAAAQCKNAAPGTDFTTLALIVGGVALFSFLRR
jgi:hypothetical protein